MGFSSFTCAKTNLPILNSTSWGLTPEAYEVVLLYKNGDRVTGSYDGYGRVDQDDGGTIEGIYGMVEHNKAKIVLKKFYTPKDKFDTVGENRREPGQGHFHDSRKITEWYAKGGFPTYEAYLQALDADDKDEKEAV